MDNSQDSLEVRETRVREYFRDPNSPHLYATYQEVLRYMPINDGNYPQQNLNLIDLHLRYRWWVREKMAPYKWIPIACLTPLLFHNFWLVLAVPAFTVAMFDHYFEAFFLWRHSKDRVLNLRLQFATKLSKPANKLRRVQLFENLKKTLQEKQGQTDSASNQKISQPPLKYIKFGDFTEYIFHAQVEGKEQSSILQTTLFETFLGLKRFILGFNQIGILKDLSRSFLKDFAAFKQDPNRMRFRMDLSALLERQQVRDVEVYTLEDNIDHNVRRFTELWRFLRRGSLEPSSFKLWEITTLSKYEDIFEPIKYNIKTNSSDLLLYYSILALPKLFTIIFRRR